MAPVPGEASDHPEIAGDRLRAIAVDELQRAGTTRARMIPVTADGCLIDRAKRRAQGRLRGGFGTSRRMIFVMMASVPSDPTSRVRQVVADDVLDDLTAGLDDLAGWEHRLEPSTYCLVVPYLNARGPPAHSATLPPMTDCRSDAGSGG